MRAGPRAERLPPSAPRRLRAPAGRALGGAVGAPPGQVTRKRVELGARAEGGAPGGDGGAEAGGEGVGRGVPERPAGGGGRGAASH